MFEIRARKQMSLGSKYLFSCCLKWSPRVFEIRARKQMSREREICASPTRLEFRFADSERIVVLPFHFWTASSPRAYPRVKKERKKRAESAREREKKKTFSLVIVLIYARVNIENSIKCTARTR